jgi:hypothetical protein
MTHIELSSEDREWLRFMASSGVSEQRLARRARVILATAEGKALELVAAQSGLSKNNCAKWKQRFVRQGIEGLADKPGRGASEDDRADTADSGGESGVQQTRRRQ